MTTASKFKPEPSGILDLPDNWEEGEDVAVSCWKCGIKMKHNEHLAACFKLVACDKCCDNYNADSSAPDEHLADEIREVVIPPLFQSTEVDRLPFPDQIDEVLFWKYSKGAKGLWITGDTRTGKTRSLCLLLERLINERVEIRPFFHGSFADELLEVIRSDRNFRRWKKEITAVPIIAIDDLFNEKLTERTEAALFEILDERIAYLRPTLVTTQVTGQEVKERFHSRKRCEAFFSRIREFFSVVTLGDKQTKLFPGSSSPAPTK